MRRSALGCHPLAQHRRRFGRILCQVRCPHKGLHGQLVCLRLALGADADAASIRGAAFSLLFSLTYLWVAWNRLTGGDGRGLGWFSLFVAITALPIAADTLRAAYSTWDWWLGLSWAAWAVLWLMFFLLLALHKPIARATAWMAIVQGVGTAWLPGYLLLTGTLG